MKVIVQAVKERLEWVNKHILPQIPHAEICLEEATEYHSNNAYRTFVRSLEMTGDEACLHLEDDVQLADDFLNKVISEVNKRPNEVIQFFSMRKADLEVGSRYEAGSKFLMAQCFYLPKGMSKYIANFASVYEERNPNMQGSPLDTMVADFLKINKITYWVVVPNLVNHRQIKSVIDPRRSTKRQSKTFKP